jgi:hypothetical protein
VCLAALAGQGRAAAQFCGTSGDIVCCGDVDGDGIVTQTDLDIATAEFEAGCSGCCLGDVNFDGAVTQADIDIIEAELVENNGQPCYGFRPVPLFAWDPNCYGDPNCAAGCQAGLGCLPIRPTTSALSSVVGVADINGDGWPDAVTWATISAVTRRRVYLNSADPGNPLSWTLACLNTGVTHATGYGHHLGDYNDDGYPDVVTSRSDTFPFLVNAADPNDPNACFFDAQSCLGLPSNINDTETLIWGDVDGDGDIDLLVQAYESNPPDPNDPVGNRLFLNLGVDDHDPNDPNNPDNCPATPAHILSMNTDPNLAITAGLQNYGAVGAGHAVHAGHDAARRYPDARDDPPEPDR